MAITRARERIIILSSIEPEELKLENIKNEGPKLLKKYLAYSRNVSEGNFKLQKTTTDQHSSDWYLSKHLINWSEQSKVVSFSIHALPFTDVMISTGKNYAAVLLTDDQLYHSSVSIKEPHAYTPLLLQQKNWSYLRVFSRSWWMNRENTENELNKFIYQITESR